MAQESNPAVWSADYRRVQQLCGVPRMNIARLFRILESEVTPVYFSHGKEKANQQLAEGLSWWRFRNGAAAFRVATVCNRYAIVSAHLNNEVIIPTIADTIDDETSAVVELGCGYGRHLFALRDLLEHRFPNLKYFGAELAETGLAAARCVAELEPGRAAITFHPFNYFSPSLDFLPKCEKIVFLTSHSIEQVNRVGDQVFHAMLASAPKVQCIHGEPVGWQLNHDVVADIASGTFASKRDTHSAFKLFAEVDDYRSAIIAHLNGWNEDLIAQLYLLQRNKVINLDRIAVNCAGNDTYNPTTMIAWHKL